eukprot:TRINITY_DN1085_c0_g1_i1.p1 TRINITY_DN1085_c0_g1~~TRINITY_DN1085_c0_g1_i1.p1  ORF type:complete len:813 (+),score=193.29 TRINITY_DN1085_c0_g1_i1:355-2439(+)
METAWDVLHDFLERHPLSEDIHYEMGELSQRSGNHSAALNHFGSHVGLHGKRSVEALNAMGMIHFQMGSLSKAEEFFRLVLKQKPDSLAAQSNVAVILERRGQTQDAIDILRNAISVHPNHPALRNNLANVYRRHGRPRDALLFADSALKLDPTMIAAHIGKALSLESIGRLEDAEGSFQDAIKVSKRTSNGLERDAVSRAISGLAIIREQLCQWKERDVLVAHMMQTITSNPGSIHPLHTFYFPFSNDERKKVAEAHSQSAVESIGNAQQLLPNIVSLQPFVESGGAKSGLRNIRIGFVSSDFAGGGVVGDYFEDVLSSFNKDKASVHCFMTSVVPEEEKITHDHDGCIYHDVATMDDVSLAGHIRRLRIHVLFNLDGWVKNARSTLWEIQAAPIQILLQGFPGTMGSKKMSFLMTHKDVVPLQDAKRFYSERMIYTPRPLIVNSHRLRRGVNLNGENGTTNTRLEWRRKLGIPSDAFVLTTFSRLQKLDPALLDVWANILRRTESMRTVLWLQEFPFAAKKNVIKEFISRGVNPRRVIFSSLLPKQTHLEVKGVVADLALDTLYFGAQGTMADILWAELPLMAITGTHMSSRLSAAAVKDFESVCPYLQQFVVHGLAQLEKNAISVISNGTLLEESRKCLRNNARSSRHFDSKQMAEQITMAAKIAYSMELYIKEGHVPFSPFSYDIHMTSL